MRTMRTAPAVVELAMKTERDVFSATDTKINSTMGCGGRCSSYATAKDKGHKR